MLNLKKKQVIVNEIKKIIKNKLSIVIIDYQGLTVNKINELRKQGRELNISMHVVRNNLMSIIVQDTSFKCLKNFFIGPTLIACSNEHPGVTIRLFKTFTKDNPSLKIKTTAFEGKIILESQLDYFTSLPTYKEAIILFISVLKKISTDRLIYIFTELLQLFNKKSHN